MIIQTNLWICEVCNAVTSESKEITIWEDPVAGPPEGWTMDGDTEDEYLLRCQACNDKFAAQVGGE